MITKEKSDPRYDEALYWAAGHFLSSYPASFTGSQILKALKSKDALPKEFRLWKTLNCDRIEVAEHIELLARSFVRFANQNSQID